MVADNWDEKAALMQLWLQLLNSLHWYTMA
jgi:hypothetical protein